MQLSDFDYTLPDSYIAKGPPKVRGSSKLMVIYTDSGEIIHSRYDKLDEFLSHEYTIVRNVTKVFKARLFSKKLIFHSGESIEKNYEILILDSGIKDIAFFTEKTLRIEALARIRRNLLKKIEKIDFGEDVVARLLSIGERSISLEFAKEDFLKAVDKLGHVPIPPYLKREDTKEDALRYNSVFAQNLGSVAAPTASLNFTKELEERLKSKNIEILDITLHVGLGTFAPLKNENILENKLHTENAWIAGDTLEKIRSSKRILSLGTTTLRCLESLPKYGLLWSKTDVNFATDIFIYHPYKFRVVDALLTNFHLPKSSLLMLVDAFLRHKASVLTWREVYEEAKRNGYKFFSYGDSMLVI